MEHHKDREGRKSGKLSFILPEAGTRGPWEHFFLSGAVMRPFVVVAIVFAACGQGRPEKPAAIQSSVALQKAASCEDLSRVVQDTAVRQMRSQLDQAKNWTLVYWGAPAAAGGAPAPAAPGAPASYSTTNTQVAGVDESDFVKNDGTRIFALSGQTLFAAKSWPPQDLAVAGKLDLEGWPSSMFLDKDQLVIFSSIWTVPTGGGMGAAARPACLMGGGGCFWGWSTTKITVVDVSVLAAPAVKSEVYLPGYATGSRRVGSSVRLVLSDGVRWPEALKWWPDYDPSLYQDKSRLVAAISALEDSNEAIIRGTPIEKWFPVGQRKLQGGATVEVGYQCGDFFVSNAPERLGLVTIATLDLAHLDAGVSRKSIVGEAGVIYANEKRLYLASEHWWWWALSGQRDYTYVHAFDLSDPLRAAYLGSGGVEGHAADSFALDEKDGYLRIATSTIQYQEDAATPHLFHFVAGSRLSVLAPSASGALTLVGEIPSLVDGERLTAMRFVGDKGFAVTFRNVDPLVTLDLADPLHPKKVAELTLPGFSTYLQPIDATHLLAIGEDLPLDGSGHADWNRRAVTLSIFDVGDLAHPARTAQALVGTAWAYSEAMWDHHAFNWYRPDAAKPGLLAIPFSDWLPPAPGRSWWSDFVSDVRVFSVDPAGSIQPLGALGMGDVYLQQGSGNFTWQYRPWVRRSVLATDAGGANFLYAVSDAGVRAAALSSLSTPLATALFPRSGP